MSLRTLPDTRLTDVLQDVIKNDVDLIDFNQYLLLY